MTLPVGQYTDNPYDFARDNGFDLPQSPLIEGAETGASTSSPPAQHPELADPFGDSTGGMTEEDLMSLLVPGYTGQAAPTQAPAPPTPPPTAPGAPPSSVSVSAKSAGFSPQKYAQLNAPKGPEAEYQAGKAGIEKQAQSEYGAFSDVFSNVSEHQAAAQKAINSAQADYDAEMAEQNSWLAQQQAQQSIDEQAAHAKWAGQIAQSRMDYVAALNDFRASGINPGQLFGDMSGGQRVGTLASVFVADFLGVKGIKTSVMDTINKAIDTNIHAQETNLKKKGEVAEGFRKVWDMQRAESASDAEARDRVYGFMLEAFKTEVMAHMGRFSSALGQAKGMAALAKIEEEQAKNLFDVYKHIDTSKNAQLQQELQWRVAKMKNAQESWSNSIAAKRLDLDKRQAAMAAMPDFLFDKDGKAMWAFRQEIKPGEQRDKVRDRMAEFQSANGAMVRLRELARKVGSSPDYVNATRLGTEDQRNFDAIADRLAHSMLKAMGERATDEDVKQMRKGLQLETYLMNGGTERILATTHEQFNDAMNGVLQQYVVPVPPEMQITNAVPRPAAGDYLDAKNTAANDPKARTVLKEGLALTDTPDRNKATPDSDIETAVKAGVKPNEEWSKYLGQLPPAERTTADINDPEGSTTFKGLRVTAAQMKAKDSGSTEGPDQAPKWATGIMLERSQANAGSKEGRDALDLLMQWAGYGDYAPSKAGPGSQILPDGTDANSAEGRLKRDFAIHELNLLDLSKAAGITQ